MRIIFGEAGETEDAAYKRALDVLHKAFTGNSRMLMIYQEDTTLHVLPLNIDIEQGETLAGLLYEALRSAREFDEKPQVLN